MSAATAEHTALSIRVGDRVVVPVGATLHGWMDVYFDGDVTAGVLAVDDSDGTLLVREEDEYGLTQWVDLASVTPIRPLGLVMV